MYAVATCKDRALAGGDSFEHSFDIAGKRVGPWVFHRYTISVKVGGLYVGTLYIQRNLKQHWAGTAGTSTGSSSR